MCLILGESLFLVSRGDSRSFVGISLLGKLSVSVFELSERVWIFGSKI